jgi:hypothetical protein
LFKYSFRNAQTYDEIYIDELLHTLESNAIHKLKQVKESMKGITKVQNQLVRTRVKTPSENSKNPKLDKTGQHPEHDHRHNGNGNNTSRAANKVKQQSIPPLNLTHTDPQQPIDFPQRLTQKHNRIHISKRTNLLNVLSAHTTILLCFLFPQKEINDGQKRIYSQAI